VAKSKGTVVANADNGNNITAKHDTARRMLFPSQEKPEAVLPKASCMLAFEISGLLHPRAYFVKNTDPQKSSRCRAARLL
jgi:hypothetical protein